MHQHFKSYVTSADELPLLTLTHSPCDSSHKLINFFYWLIYFNLKPSYTVLIQCSGFFLATTEIIARQWQCTFPSNTAKRKKWMRWIHRSRLFCIAFCWTWVRPELSHVTCSPSQLFWRSSALFISSSQRP